MYVVKSIVGNIPKPVKNLLKKSTWLFQTYRQALHKSGLFYGVPSPKEMDKLYRKHQKDQEAIFSDITNDDCSHFTIFIMDNEKANLAITLDSVNQMTTAAKNVVVCSQSERRISDKNTSFAGIHFFSGKSVVELRESFPLLDFNNSLFINAGDRLHPKALSVFKFYSGNCNYSYCDTDLMSKSGSRKEPYFKPDWNPDLHLTTEYVDSGLYIRNIFTEIKYIDFTRTISSWLISAFMENSKLSVGHVDSVLIHQLERSFANKENDNLFAAKQCDLSQISGIRHIQWHHQTPLVSIIIPTYNAHNLVRVCVESILTKTNYSNFEIILVDNNSDDLESIEYFSSLNENEKIRVLKFPYEFNYSAINNFAVSKANGEYIALVNNDIEVISDNWLENMVGQASRMHIGCVGAKLLYADNRVQHAGVIVGYGGGAGHAHKYYPSNHNGYMNRLAATHNFSAVTAACLLVKKSIFEQVNGLNEEHLKVAFNDVDFCLKVASLGYRNILSVESVLYHHESVSRGHEDTPAKQARFDSELAYLQSTWQKVIAHDPAYNKHLTLSRENFALRGKHELN